MTKSNSDRLIVHDRIGAKGINASQLAFLATIHFMLDQQVRFIDKSDRWGLKQATALQPTGLGETSHG